MAKRTETMSFPLDNGMMVTDTWLRANAIPEPPESGTYQLIATNGVVTWESVG